MSISVGSDGIIEIAQFGQDEPVQIGQLELARFVNPSGLNALGSNLYQRTTASGDALIDVPTQSGLGQIDQGYLEGSNVKVVDEMVT